MALYLTYAGMRPVKDWLHRCYSRSFAHGAELVESWRIADNVATSCRALDLLVDAGWIIPNATSTPTLEMRVFGVGGRSGAKNGQKWRASHSYACEFGYAPNYDCAEFTDWIRSSGDIAR